ncbi:MAG: helix-turn-helix domain-containing protein [Verrucomicrobiae bacterium]|nr:helix-turn-helix domain-containing protein [Verrucomicrobiae bacterium]
MKNQLVSSNPANHGPLYDRLATSQLFQVYRKAFEAATGLPLALKPADASAEETAATFRNPFCSQINRNGCHCGPCQSADQCLVNRSESQAHTMKCFAGLKETAVPVRSGGQTIAFLTTGQVFDKLPNDNDFDEVCRVLRDSGFPANRLRGLKSNFLAGRVVDEESYQGMVTLLGVFALQLSETLNRLMIEDAHAEPPVVVSAKQFINANLEDRITLDQVAAHVCVSPYYFCKVFKQATGMTLTEYVNRRRVERAKRKLLVPHARVTEVAYEVGYQSLSQFNRSFLKYVGMSPTRFRDRSAAEKLRAA